MIVKFIVIHHTGHLEELDALNGSFNRASREGMRDHLDRFTHVSLHIMVFGEYHNRSSCSESIRDDFEEVSNCKL